MNEGNHNGRGEYITLGSLRFEMAHSMEGSIMGVGYFRYWRLTTNTNPI